MLNPILGAVNQSKLTSPIKQAMNFIRAAQNPQQAVTQMAQSNPKVMDIIQQNGGDAQKAFYATAKQLGVDGDEIIKMIQGKG